jgi:hypothetical protein
MQTRSHRGVRRPVRRESAETYLLVTLLSFAASVALTRLFLELAGYPQLGNSQLHIAHVLWGGLLLFVASLLPLVFANRWVYTVGAVAAGVGVGLFIDEVGKFITQNNDYFHPTAAPIIYAVFLLTVLLYLRVRRPRARDTRAELYRAFDALQEVLDHDLEPQERAELEACLGRVAGQSDHPDMARLAEGLLKFLASEDLSLAPEMPGFMQRRTARVRALEARWISRRRLKAALAGGLAALGVVTSANLVGVLLAPEDPARLGHMIGRLVALGRLTSTSGLVWLAARVALEGVMGLLLLTAAILLVVGKERSGLGFAYFGLLLSLAAVNLLVFYFDQFSTILTATVQFALLLGVLHYRRRYVTLPEA